MIKNQNIETTWNFSNPLSYSSFFIDENWPKLGEHENIKGDPF